MTSDVKIAHRPELLAIETSSETQRLLDEANEVLVDAPKPKPVVKNATKKAVVTKKVEATKKPVIVAPKKAAVAEKKPKVALVQKKEAQKVVAKPVEAKTDEKSEH